MQDRVGSSDFQRRKIMLRKRRLAVFFLLLLVLLTSCSQSKEYNKITAEEFQWQDFSWASYDSNGLVFDKGAIFIPIQFDNSDTTYWLQLDTGISNSPLYENSFNSLSPRPSFESIYGFLGLNKKMLMNVKIGNYQIENFLCNIKNDFGSVIDNSSNQNQIGSLGLDFFKNKILLLDFPNKRFAIATSDMQLPESITEKVTYHKAELVNNFFVFDLKIDTQTYKFGYDTGASGFPLVVNYDLWRKLTGKVGNEPDITLINAPSWGKTLTLIGSSTKEDVFLSEKSLGSLEMFYIKEEPNFFKTARIDGLISNASFYDDSLIIIDLINMRFGVVKMVE
jgi:hypothetical protein